MTVHEDDDTLPIQVEDKPTKIKKGLQEQDSNLIPVNKQELERIIAENRFLKNASDVSLASLLNQLDSDDESLGEALTLTLNIYTKDSENHERLGDALTHAVNVFLRRDRTKKQIQERLKQVKPVGKDNQQQQT